MRALVVIAVTTWSAAAFAHEAHQTATSVDQTFSVSTAWRAGSFAFDDVNRGHYQTLGAALDWSPIPALTLGAEVPWSYIRLRDGRGALGLGDVSTGIGANFGNGPISGAIGLTAGFPTGDPDVGIGSGHAELIPQLSGDARLGTFTVHAAASHSEALGRDDDDGVPHGALLAPHGRRETHVGLSAAYALRPVELAVGGRGVITYGLPMGGTSALVKITLRPSPRWAFGTQFEAPVTGFQRFRWRTGVLATFHWN